MPTTPLAEAKRTEAERLTAPYRRFYNAEDPTDLVPPDALVSAIAANIVRHPSKLNPGSHYFRLRKGRPNSDTDPDAYIFRVLRDHATPSGRYLPIDSLMIARHLVPSPRYDYDTWDRTVSVLAAIDRAEV